MSATPALAPDRTMVLACATVIEDLGPRLPAGMATRVLDFGLHRRPGGLRGALQAAIDQADGFDAVLLGYGLCSRAIVGLRATHGALVMPRVDDCISIFLGSRQAFEHQARGEPGTYYLTKGWIEAGDGPFGEEARIAERYGAAKAELIVRRMLGHYTRLAFIDTGVQGLDGYRARARAAAERFGLRYEEIPGSSRLVEKLVAGPWDDEVLVVEDRKSVV